MPSGPKGATESCGAPFAVAADDESILTQIRGMLRSRLVVTNADRQSFPFGYETDDAVIASNRYILLLRGAMDYKVEGIVTRITPGVLVLVPAWVRRHWRVTHPSGCEILWCEFSSFAMEARHHALFRARDISAEIERGSLERLLAIWRRTGRESATVPDLAHSFAAEQTENLLDLQLEGELKATLSRFWASAERQAGGEGVARQHPQIEKAVAIIDHFFHRPDALDILFQQLELSQNHFRLLFRQHMQTSAREYLNGVRLRRARHLLHHTDKAIKAIAFETGFKDPLNFSRQYRAYWGHAPRVGRSHRTAS